jgi:hypothetical protein
MTTTALKGSTCPWWPSRASGVDRDGMKITRVHGGGNAKSRNQRSMSTGSIGSDGDLSHLDFGSPPPRGASGLDAKFRRTRSVRDRRFAARSPSEGESSREDTSCEEGLGFHTTRYPLANSDRRFPSSRASTSDTETRSPKLHTKPLPARPPGSKTPPFNLVDATFDPSLGPKCRARVGRPEGIRSSHASDDDPEAFQAFPEAIAGYSRVISTKPTFHPRLQIARWVGAHHLGVRAIPPLSIGYRIQ